MEKASTGSQHDGTSHGSEFWLPNIFRVESKIETRITWTAVPLPKAQWQHIKRLKTRTRALEKTLSAIKDLCAVCVSLDRSRVVLCAEVVYCFAIRAPVAWAIGTARRKPLLESQLERRPNTKYSFHLVIEILLSEFLLNRSRCRQG